MPRETGGRPGAWNCPVCPTSAADVAAAAMRCSSAATSVCAPKPTSAAHSVAVSVACSNAASIAARGFFVISLAVSGEPVCTGGDRYHAWVSGTDGNVHFAALSQPSGGPSHVYWVNTSASAALQGSRRFTIELALAETRRREGGETEAERARSEWSLSTWLREGVCVWRQLAQDVPAFEVEDRRPAGAPEPLCTAVPEASSMAYVALPEVSGPPGVRWCGRDGAICSGDAQGRLLNTSNVQRLAHRRARGFAHVLKPVACRFGLLEEAEAARCMGGQAVLNVGSTVAVDVQRGFARLNSSLAAWTRRRPGTTAEQRVPFHLRLPQVADFHYQFERSGGFNSRLPDLMVGVSRFGSGSLETLLIHHPAHAGLANVLEPEEVAKVERRVGLKHAAAYAKLMCEHDVVLLESGVHDFGMPFTAQVTPAPHPAPRTALLGHASKGAPRCTSPAPTSLGIPAVCRRQTPFPPRPPCHAPCHANLPSPSCPLSRPLSRPHPVPIPP